MRKRIDKSRKTYRKEFLIQDFKISNDESLK